MKKPEKPLKQDQVFNRKTLDRAFILPLLGLVLLVSPLAKMFQIDVWIAGIPFTVLYLFIVWGLLIIGAACLAGKLRHHQFNSKQDTVTDETQE